MDLHHENPVRSEQQSINESRECLVRFHNCTSHDVTPYWIDFKGDAIKYPEIKSGYCLEMKTFDKHYWIFGPSKMTRNHSNDYVKIIAISEDQLTKTSLEGMIESGLALEIERHIHEEHSVEDGPQALLGTFVCALCKYISVKYSVIPAKVPCHHLTGKCKHSPTGHTFFYSCNNHQEIHSKARQNIYLVEQLLSLQELSFLALKDVHANEFPQFIRRELVLFREVSNKLQWSQEVQSS